MTSTALAPQPRFVLVRHEPDRPPPGRSAPHVPAPRAHRGSRGTPLVPGSARAGAREAAARRRAELVVRIALEVFAGHRPVTQLGRYAAPEVLRYVAAGLPSPGPGGPARVRSVHCHPVGRTAAEVVAVCRFGGRHRALAARLDLTPTGEWRCTALRVL